MDDKDALLLMALERNARASVVDLARKIGLSRSATQERLARLEDRGAIAAYTIKRGVSDEGIRVRALLAVRHASTSNCAKNIPLLEQIVQIKSIYAIAGDTDLMVELSVADVAELEEVTAKIRGIAGIEQVTSHVILKSYFEGRA